MNSVQHVSRKSWDQDVLRSPVPVLVDFYADWCGPCRMLAPVLERLSVEFEGRIRIVKVNVDQEPHLANQFQVQSIPTLMFLANGAVVGRTSGMVGEADLRNVLQALAQTATPSQTHRRAV